MAVWDALGVALMVLNAERSATIKDGRWTVQPLNLIAALALATNLAWRWGYGR